MKRDTERCVNVSIFTVVMLLVAAGLVVVFGQFRFASGNTYHATFTEASRLKAGQDVRIAGVPVGSVKDVKLNPDNTVDVAFDVNDRYQLYTSTQGGGPLREPGRRPLPRDHLGPRRSAQAAGRRAPSPRQNTQPALDLDALLGGLRPVLKGLDGNKINEVSNAVIELLQGQGGALSTLLVQHSRRSPRTSPPATSSSATSSTTSTRCSAPSTRRARSSTPASTSCSS